MNKHAPFRAFRVTRPASPWLTDEIRKQMDTRDQYKNKFNLDYKSPESEQINKTLRNSVCHSIRLYDKNKKINEKLKMPSNSIRH